MYDIVPATYLIDLSLRRIQKNTPLTVRSWGDIKNKPEASDADDVASAADSGAGIATGKT